MSEKKDYQALVKQIRHHNDRYYNQDDPEITDYEYDQLMLKLKAMEKEHPEWITKDSPTQKVGGSAKRRAGVLVQHRNPMLSLQDVFSKEEVEQFVADCQGALKHPRFVVETKIDGLSMSLRYENGELVLAETRGDGILQGEDVTANARMIGDIVASLPEKVPYVELRGEVYMENEAFEEVNAKQELLGKKTFANPRNCAAGTLRQLDPSVTKERRLSMFIFNIQETQGISFNGHVEGYEWLKRQGVKIIDTYFVCDTFQEIWSAIEKIGEMRGNLAYDIDGAVVKLDSFTDRAALGTTSKVPRWAVAYKYPPEEKEATVLDIELSVGRTGRITPTAVFTPIRLCGTTVSRATLHNQDFIDSLGVGIGSHVLVYKSGEIIPKIKQVVKTPETKTVPVFQLPDTCPVCGKPTVREEDTADLKCINPACPSQIQRNIINFVSRDAMDIKGFGEVYIQLLTEQGYLRDVADIYDLHLHREELIEQGLIGKEKNTDKLLAAIEGSKKNSPERLVTGLGIPNIGKAAAKALIRKFGSLEALEQADVESLCSVEDIGEISARAIRQFFEREEVQTVIERLKARGVNMTAQKQETGEGPFSGQTIVVTGTLPTMGRKEVTELIEKNGGKVAGSVSKKTSFLVAGEAAGSKLTKAQQLGIPVVTEEELLGMLK